MDGSQTDVFAAGVHCVVRSFYCCFEAFLNDGRFEFAEAWLGVVKSLVGEDESGNDSESVAKQFEKQIEFCLFSSEDEAEAAKAGDLPALFHSIIGILSKVLAAIRTQSVPVRNILPIPGTSLPSYLQKKREIERHVLAHQVAEMPCLRKTTESSTEPASVLRYLFQRPTSATVCRKKTRQHMNKKLAAEVRSHHLKLHHEHLEAVSPKVHNQPDVNPMTRKAPTTAKVSALSAKSRIHVVPSEAAVKKSPKPDLVAVNNNNVGCDPRVWIPGWTETQSVPSQDKPLQPWLENFEAEYRKPVGNEARHQKWEASNVVRLRDTRSAPLKVCESTPLHNEPSQPIGELISPLRDDSISFASHVASLKRRVRGGPSRQLSTYDSYSAKRQVRESMLSLSSPMTGFGFSTAPPIPMINSRGAIRDPPHSAAESSWIGTSLVYERG